MDFDTNLIRNLENMAETNQPEPCFGAGPGGNCWKMGAKNSNFLDALPFVFPAPSVFFSEFYMAPDGFMMIFRYLSPLKTEGFY